MGIDITHNKGKKKGFLNQVGGFIKTSSIKFKEANERAEVKADDRRKKSIIKLQKEAKVLKEKKKITSLRASNDKIKQSMRPKQSKQDNYSPFGSMTMGSQHTGQYRMQYQEMDERNPKKKKRRNLYSNF